MKKILSRMLFLAFAIANLCCTTLSVDAQLLQNNTLEQVEITHDKPKYVKKGNYIYKFDKNDNLLGYYKKTPSGKIIEYNSNNKKVATYKPTPGGDLDIRFSE